MCGSLSLRRRWPLRSFRTPIIDGLESFFARPRPIRGPITREITRNDQADACSKMGFYRGTRRAIRDHALDAQPRSLSTISHYGARMAQCADGAGVESAHQRS